MLRFLFATQFAGPKGRQTLSLAERVYRPAGPRFDGASGPGMNAPADGVSALRAVLRRGLRRGEGRDPCAMTTRPCQRCIGPWDVDRITREVDLAKDPACRACSHVHHGKSINNLIDVPKGRTTSRAPQKTAERSTRFWGKPMSTYYSLHYHLVFSTKHRKPWIKGAWSERLHGYLGGTLAGMDIKPLTIGGVADHVHLLMGAKTTHRICDVVRELKKAATDWVHTEIRYEPFRWQEGYSIFSVSPNALKSVATYIDHQGEHHRTLSFREELMDFLDKAGIEYDPQYLE